MGSSKEDSKPERHSCSWSVHSALGSFPCGRAGTHRERGEWWCWQHAPSRVKATQKAWQDRREKMGQLRDRRDLAEDQIDELELTLIDACCTLEKAEPPDVVEKAVGTICDLVVKLRAARERLATAKEKLDVEKERQAKSRPGAKSRRLAVRS